MAAARGAELGPATAAELRQLRATNRRQAQELDILKKAIASKGVLLFIRQIYTLRVQIPDLQYVVVNLCPSYQKGNPF